MNRLFSSALTAVFSLTILWQGGYAAGDESSDVFDKGVLVLNDDNFDDAIGRYDYLLINFYNPEW